MATYGINENHHIIAANEGNCTALAAGYYLSTGKIPVVYMQSSGEGNIIIYQGEITLKLLEDMGIEAFAVSKYDPCNH